MPFMGSAGVHRSMPPFHYPSPPPLPIHRPVLPPRDYKRTVHLTNQNGIYAEQPLGPVWLFPPGDRGRWTGCSVTQFSIMAVVWPTERKRQNEKATTLWAGQIAFSVFLALVQQCFSAICSLMLLLSLVQRIHYFSELFNCLDFLCLFVHCSLPSSCSFLKIFELLDFVNTCFTMKCALLLCTTHRNMRMERFAFLLVQFLRIFPQGWELGCLTLEC